MGDLADFITPRPEVERLAGVREQAKVCIAFYTYLEVIGCVVLPPKGYDGNLREILCAFFGVDEAKLNNEKIKL